MLKKEENRCLSCLVREAEEKSKGKAGIDS